MARLTAALLVALIGGANPFVLPGAPHPCYLKAPSYFNRLLLQFAGASGSGGSVEEGAPAPSEVRVVAQWKATEAAAEL